MLNGLQLLESELQGNVEEIRGRFQDSKLLRQWRQWALETIEWSRLHRKPALVYDHGHLAEELPVDLGWNPWRVKIRQGDGATPEGQYSVKKKKSSGETKYFLALLLDYPNHADRATFSFLKRNGEISKNTGIGNLIEIHGEGGREVDWTEGCVALDNPSMRRRFETAYTGMPVTIVGRIKR